MKEKEFLHQIDDLFSKQECDDFIKKIEKMKEWKTVDRGIALYDRVTINDQELADRLFMKIKHLIPEYFMGQRVIGLNNYFRFSKYYPGGRFGIHKDGINTDKDGNRAIMTLNIFLNTPEKGGGTIFYKEPDEVFQDNYDIVLDARPIPGRGALFYNQILHEGETVDLGLKYLIRTDVMVSIF